jgi:hypothetical protein
MEYKLLQQQEDHSEQGRSEKQQSMEEGASQGWRETYQEVGKYTYHWCVHHVSWTIHPPAKCRLGKQHKEEQKTKPATTVCANAATYAVAAATQINPHYQAMLAALADEDNE